MDEMKCKVCGQEPDREHQVFVSTHGGWLCKNHWDPIYDTFVDWDKFTTALWSTPFPIKKEE